MTASTALAAPGGQLRRRFEPGIVCQARVGIIPLRVTASNRAELDTQVLFGERVTVLAYRRGWMRVRAHLDGKEGFVRSEYFSDKLFKPTHRVIVPSVLTTAYRPVQSHLMAMLGMNACVRVTDTLDKFSRIHGAGWVNSSCLKPIGEYEQDFVDVACRFLRTPYFWGGRTGFFIDCSGLVQAALIAAGYKDVPRDSGPQSQRLGVPIVYENGLCRGDLVFWKGHVGIMVDRYCMLHATDDVMSVVVEPLEMVIQRRKREEPEGKREITVVRRLPEYAKLLGRRS